MNDREFYEIYDEYGNGTGKIVEHDYVLAEGEYRAICHVAIINANNEMLIQKRSSDKADFPDRYDISAGGGVNAGEDTYAAAKREMFEELGLALKFARRPYMRIFYPKGIDDYYICLADVKLGDVRIGSDEVQAVRWAAKDEILAMMKNGEFVSYNEGFIDFLFSMSRNRGTYVK